MVHEQFDSAIRIPPVSVTGQNSTEVNKRCTKHKHQMFEWNRTAAYSSLETIV